MLPCERVIVRFSIACLFLSLLAGVVPLAFPERLSLIKASLPARFQLFPANAQHSAREIVSQRTVEKTEQPEQRGEDR